MTTFSIVGEGEPYSDGAVLVALRALEDARRRHQRANALRRGRRAPASVRVAADQAVSAATLALYEAQPNTFELSRGTSIVITPMAQFGMLDVDSLPEHFPTRAECGMTDAVIREWSESGDEPLPVARFLALRDAVRDRQAMPNPVGIPAYKLKQAEAWLITSDEITAALGAYRTALGDGAIPPALAWWDHWLAFLERAGRHLGVRVS